MSSRWMVAVLMVAACDDARYEAIARTWMAENQIPGRATCHWYMCDVVPSDGRNPIKLRCNDLYCQIDYPGN